ncbi:MAG: rhomboid family intramembrane serine protease [Chlorobi bacterium]|nr:rhomboid family intramembrane serine protease [Chlorobiota bacterium]
MDKEKRRLLQSMRLPLLFIAILWAIKLGEIATNYSLSFLGVYPLRFSGLIGILTAPLIHANINHLFANSVPFFVLGSTLMFFYRGIALKVFVLIYLLTGFCVWLGAFEAYHIGVSGVVYGLASFLFFSGIFRKDVRLMAITLFVAFLYGGLIWGIFPEYFPEKNVSTESHFWGLTIGTILAFYYRKQGPKKKKYDWEYEEEEEMLENFPEAKLTITYSRKGHPEGISIEEDNSSNTRIP